MAEGAYVTHPQLIFAFSEKKLNHPYTKIAAWKNCQAALFCTVYPILAQDTSENVTVFLFPADSLPIYISERTPA